MYRLQNNFSRGEADPKLQERHDMDLHSVSVEQALNIRCLIQGGITRRDGLRYLEEITDGTNAIIIPFEFDTEEVYALIFRNGEILVYYDDILRATLTASDFTNERLDTVAYTQYGDTLILVHAEIPPTLLKRNGSHSNWTIETISFSSPPLYSFTQSETTPSAHITPNLRSGNVTITSSSGIFNSSHVGQYIEGNSGKARIVEYVSSTKVKVVTEIDFFDTDAILSGTWTLTTGYEVVWSATRGYPISVIFANGRLWFAGTKSRPNTLWGSRIELYFDFDKGTALPTDAVEYTIDSGQLNMIVNLNAMNDLQIFTTGAEYILTEGVNEIPSIRKQSSTGSEYGLPLLNVENITLFIQRGRKNVSGFAYTEESSSYVARNISFWNSHLIFNIRNIAFKRGRNIDEGSEIYIVRDDGVLVVCTTSIEQGVFGFSRYVTQGKFLNVNVVGSTVYVLVEREINGESKVYFEKFEPGLLLDSVTTYEFTNTSTSIFSSLEHLEGKEVSVILGDSVMQNQTVLEGVVEAERLEDTKAEIGLNFDVKVRTLPYFFDIRYGSLHNKKKTISSVYLLLNNTRYLTINGSSLSTIGENLDGLTVRNGFLGWSKEAYINISQTQPAPMTILSLTTNLLIA